MDRKHVLWTGVFVSAFALLYAVSFGPVIYLVIKAERAGAFPTWLETPLTVTFYPHLWAAYRYEPYFDYIAWLVNGTGGNFTWQDYREKHADKFGT